jgi:hypothetical protein
MSTATARTWRMYPDVLSRRGRAVARDGGVLLCLILLAWAGIRVHDDIAGLDRLCIGVAQAVSSVQQGFGAAAAAVGGVPIVGGQLSGSLRTAGVDCGGAAASSARQADRDIGRAATLIGWLIFLLPAAVLLGRYLPCRVRQIRQMTAAPRVLIDSGDGAQRRLIAERGAFSLPCRQLLRHTRQPLTNLAEGHYQPLIDAILEDAGIRRRPRQPTEQ